MLQASLLLSNADKLPATVQATRGTLFALDAFRDEAELTGRPISLRSSLSYLPSTAILRPKEQRVHLSL